MFKIVEKLDEKGRIEGEDIPDSFKERCERLRDFAEAVNNVYEIFKVDMSWRNKVQESRALVSQQLEGLSDVISGLASEIDMNIQFRNDLEDIIIMELGKKGIKASEVMVYENRWGKYEINIFHKGCGGKRQCVTDIEKIVSEVTGHKMSRRQNECCMEQKGNICALRLVEEESYRVTTGLARVPKYNNDVSGDTYTFMNSEDGKYILAISDGMGSGQKAAAQSQAAVDMLESFIESGFDKDTAIKMINSILVLKSSDDSYATIDLSVIDLYDGNAEFVKIGAVPTYIKRGERVEALRSVSIPAGILGELEADTISKKVKSGDFIIMMSDGILDAFKSRENQGRDMDTFLSDIKSVNPQEIADMLLAQAKDIWGGKPQDDMMVLVAKVWRRAA